jgi:hypothetical protein
MGGGTLIAWLFAFVVATDVHKVYFSPFDFQRDDLPATHTAGIKQIEFNGEDLLIPLLRRPSILQIRTDGTFVRAIGKKGSGPGELGWHATWAIAAKGQGLWVLRDDLSLLNYYEKGKYEISFRPKGYQFRGARLPAYRFAFDNEHVVVPVHPSTGFLAYAYDYGGSVRKKVGQILRIDTKYLARNPGINSTIWANDGTQWYCLFVHRPIVRVFDKHFELKKEFTVQGPEIEVFEAAFRENEKDPDWTYPKPHFTDMKIRGKDLFLLCNGVLYQMNREDGEVLSRSYFYGDKAFQKFIGNQRAEFQFFALDGKQNIFLGMSHLLLEHDMAVARLPFQARVSP